ncbi:winged helix-turn-helix domain-containing protein [Xanthomonas axonopodis]|uniref:nSTAND1 domain-containing NTPase n=1 Tax=Xanthomonas axonopodis TaxID=53413 RepID=UPI000ACC0339
MLVEPELLTLIDDGQTITLEPRMVEVMIALAERAGEVISAEQLLIEVWHGSFYGDNPVHKTIAQLRRKLGDDSRQPRFIETIRKRGYRLLPKVVFPDDYRGAVIGTQAWGHGNPYMGLQAFDPAHAEVFFGRSHAIAQVLGALRAQLHSQRGLVLVSGASGCVKTSLLRAGVVPLLCQPGRLGWAGRHRGGVLQPGAMPRRRRAGHAGARTGAMGTGRTRGVVAGADGTPAPMAAATCPAACGHRAAMRQSAPARDNAHTQRHLLLVIDHAEAMVATPGITAADRAALTAALHALCASAHVAVLMLTRNDFYPRLIDALPDIVELKRGDRHVDLLPPRDGEICQIIRVPAAMAGLRFEEEHSGADRLEGALAHHAEQTFRALPSDAQAALGHVLTLLSVIHPDSDAVTARRALWSALPASSAARVLVDAFVHAHLRALATPAPRLYAAALLVVLANASLLLGWQARQAQQAAEQRRDQAQQLVGYMLSDLAEQLRTVGNLKLLDSVGSRALRYLEDLPSASMHTGDLINHARALRTTGEVLMNQGKVQEAHAAFTRAAATAQRARMRAPDALEAHAETGQAAYWLGYLAYQAKQPPLARTYWSQYLATCEHLVHAAPQDPRWQLELSYALNNLGTLSRSEGHATAAIDFFARSHRAQAPSIGAHAG